jgi:hypothetical protein
MVNRSFQYAASAEPTEQKEHSSVPPSHIALAAEPTEQKQYYSVDDLAVVIKTGTATESRVENMRQTWLLGLPNVLVINSEKYGKRPEASAYFESEAYTRSLAWSAVYSQATKSKTCAAPWIEPALWSFDCCLMAHRVLTYYQELLMMAAC